ncbi:PIN domain-containing protein [Candidatus Kaiserbacteria bacterium]|nr:PIN domain-containing protein [Candidatus Kaiserbacteria bacterium]
METSKASIVLDSSVWIAYLHKEDSQHEKAREVVGNITDIVLVPEEVLSEVATAFKRLKRDDLAKNFVRRVISGESSLFVLDETIVYKIATTFLSRSDRLSFTDIALLVLAQEYRVITFDRQLQKAIEQL